MNKGDGKNEKGEKGDKSNKDIIKPAKILGKSASGSGSSSGKQPEKRLRSDSSQNASMEGELTVLSQQMDGMSNDIQTIRDDLKHIMRKSEMETFIHETVTKIISEMNQNIDTIVDMKVDEKTKANKTKITELESENEQLKKDMIYIKTQLTNVKIKVTESEERSKAALAKANYNEQYSRKNNIKILNITEEQNETEDTLKTKVDKILTDRGVPIDPEKIVAMHRIPGKPGNPKPVLLKLQNNNEKTKIMKKRSDFKAAGNRLVDDVTKLNAGLIKRLSDHSDMDSAWYFNGAVYGKAVATGKRHKFDLYDDVTAILRA